LTERPDCRATADPIIAHPAYYRIVAFPAVDLVISFPFAGYPRFRLKV
jgi:hypothetical protein